MKKLFKVLVLFILFFSFLIIFLPKEKVFFYTLNALSKKNILFKSYIFEDKPYSFYLKDSKIYYKNIQALKIQDFSLNTYIVYNKLIINGIKVDDSLKQFVPSNIKNVNIKYSVLNPLFIDIDIYSKEFKVKGYIDILQEKLVLNLNVSKMFKKQYSKLLRQIKYDNKTKEYKYEYKL